VHNLKIANAVKRKKVSIQLSKLMRNVWRRIRWIMGVIRQQFVLSHPQQWDDKSWK
jgi:hypothetical protein